MPENVLNGDHAVEVKGASGEPHEIEGEPAEEDVHFEPIVSLPLIEVSNNEEDETELIKLRAKLYRYDSTNHPPEWKERGTGEVKLLRHNTKNTVRVVMRRDKTLKICANHFVTPWMELKPNCGSDRAWIWSVLADFADELLKPELLAIRFANAENASRWKEAFEKAKKIVGSECEIYAGKSSATGQEDSSDDSCCEVSYSDSSDNDEATKNKAKEQSAKSEGPEDSEEKTESVTGELEKLKVKDEEQDK